jgi:Recombination endonuclease VII
MRPSVHNLGVKFSDDPREYGRRYYAQVMRGRVSYAGYKRNWRLRKLEEKSSRSCPVSCELCGKVPQGKRLAWDHNHATGEFRGWLCDTCNRGLGLFNDDPILMRKAANYVESNSDGV